MIDRAAAIIATNGIQELSHEIRGGMSDFIYVRGALIEIAYHQLDTADKLKMNESEFYDEVLAEAERLRTEAKTHA